VRRVVIGLVLAATALAAMPAASRAASAPTTGYAVGTRVVTFVDSSRSTPEFGTTAASPHRVLVTHLWFPTAGTPGRAATSGGTPTRRGAPFPLIVFAHGDAGHALNYAVMLTRWAAAGYVVAAPDFPVSSRDGRAGITDVVNQPGDLSVVIDGVLRLNRARTELAGLVDPRRIGVAGHSLGGATVVGLVERSCCRDHRVQAAISFSGLALVPGSDYPRPAVSLLLVHGDADTTVPYAGSTNVYAAVGQPRFLLTLLGRGHQSWPATRGAADMAVLQSTLDFWAAYLRHEPGAERRLERDAVVPGLTTFQADPGPAPA
jgi:dienelactone hydrolase